MDLIMDVGDGTQRVIEAEALRALLGYCIEQRDALTPTAAPPARPAQTENEE